MTNTERTPPITAKRIAPAVYLARHDNGAEVRVGLEGTEATFTPGELLRVAVAACAALSAEHLLVHRLGSDFNATLSVAAVKDMDENRYSTIVTELAADMSELDEDRHAGLIERSLRAIDRLCTVGRTVEAGAVVETHVVADSA